MTTVREMMTGDPEHVEDDATIADVADVMRKLNVGSVPVVTGGAIQGIVTDRDIALRAVAEDRAPGDVRAGEIATASPVTVSPEMSVEAAGRLMAEHQIRRLPVVEDGRLVGMLSLGDLSVAGNAREAGMALERISTPAAPRR